MPIGRWLLFFVIALGLGYPAVMRYSPPTVGGLSDTAHYFAMAGNGVDAEESGHWQYRVLIPALAKPIRSLLFTLTGRPESTAAAMLVVTAAFTATTATVIGLLAHAVGTTSIGTTSIGATSVTATLASLLWLSSFPVANYQLAGMVDSAESLAVAVLLLAGLLNRWPLVLAIPVLAFAKETVVPLSVAAAIGFLIYYHSKQQPYRHAIACTAALAGLGLVSVAAAHWLVDDSWAGLWALINDEHGGGNLLVNLWQALVNRGNLYVFIALLPAGLLGRKHVPASLWLAAGLAAVGALALGSWNSAGPNVARPLFSALGPVLAVGAAGWLARHVETPGARTT